MSSEAKITAALSPMINEMTKAVNNTIVTNRCLTSQEEMKRHEELVGMLQVITDLLKEGQVAKKVVKAPVAKTPREEAPEEAPKVAAKFPISARAWYLANYVASDEFKEKYSNDTLDKAANDSKVVSGKPEAEKPAAIALCKWNACKKSCETLMATIEADYAKAKAEYDTKAKTTKAKAAQQTTEEFDD